MTRKALLLLLPLLLLVGFAAPSAQARDDHRGRNHRDSRRTHVVRHYDRGGQYRHGSYGSRRHHGGYWRNYHGRRYWYEDGGYFVRPGGVSINIGL